MLRGQGLSAMSITANHHHYAAPFAGGVIDPVCAMTVDPHTAKHRADYRGHTYYFCAAGCRAKFIADPQKYLGKREPEPVVEGATYTCPMHPEIRQVGPRRLPDLRHGFGTRDCDGRHRPQSRTR